MIAQWMIAATVFSLLMYVGALGVDRTLRVLGMPSRFAWTASLAMSVVWPVLAMLLLEPPVSADGTAVIAGAPIAVGAAGTSASTLSLPTARELDLTILTMWGCASIVLLIRLVRGSLLLHRIGRAARESTVDGTAVLVSDGVGPAAIGLRRPRVIVPAWIDELDASLRRLVVTHEREHCAARDPLLTWSASLATALMPWNPALWLSARRLRLALEIDCDSRTLRGDSSSEARQRYGRLLLLIAQRAGAARLAPMLAHTPTHLTSRIHAMRANPVKHRAFQIVGSLLFGVLALTAACSQRVANALAGPAPVRADDSPAPLTASPAPESAAQDKPYFDFQVDKPVLMAPGSRGPLYPEELKAAKVEGQVLAQFVVGPSGRADMSTVKVLKTTHEQFSESVRTALAAMQFIPAQKDGKTVTQLVQQPFMFALSGTPATPARRQDGPTVVPKNAALFDFQTEQSAKPVAGTKAPEFPAELRAARTEGSVLIQVVVDENGKPMMSSFKVLKSDHLLFAESVKSALAETQFSPAMVGGKAVRQLVQLPYQFALSR